MPVNKHVKQQEVEMQTARTPLATAVRKSGRKAPGTRLGTLEDWREGSQKNGRGSGPCGKAIRDGR